MNNKLTKLEKFWVLYDVGNSAFTMLVATILPIYYNGLAEAAGISSVNYLATWGYAMSLCTIIVAFIGPILGTMADVKGYKKPIFTFFMIVGVLGCAALSVPKTWIVFLAIFVITKVGYNASLVFYDAMLTDITSEDRMDMVSTNGYAWGYIGSGIPFIISLVFVLMYEKFGITMSAAMTLAFMINAIWWVGLSIPLLKNYKQIHYIEKPKNVIRTTFTNLGEAFKEILDNKRVLLFLLAFFFYIDGVYTVIEMATAYGSAVGLDTTGLLLALLLTQIVAFPASLFFAKLSKTIETGILIKICIVAYIGISLFAIGLDVQWEFWFLAVCVGLFQGAVQALSRSYFAKIIPAEKSGKYFGIYDICGKGASFLGTTLVSVFAQITGRANGGIIVISVLLVIGFILFMISEKFKKA